MKTTTQTNGLSAQIGVLGGEEIHVLEIRLLGRPRVLLGGAEITAWVSDKARALLFYLVVTGDVHSRQALASLLWGDMPEPRALLNLRQVIYNLQQLVGAYLVVNNKTVGFDARQPHRLDVAAFNAARVGAEATIEALRAAVDLYRGEFLEGFYLDDCPEFERWLLSERERLHYRALEILDALATREAAEADYPAAIRTLRRLLALAPWNESDHRRLMLLLARTGQYAEALAHYGRTRELLARELDAEPMPETQALYERIRRARSTARLSLPARGVRTIGRARELGRLDQLLAGREHRLVTVVGAAGVGKTHLALEVAARQVQAYLDGVRYVPLRRVMASPRAGLVDVLVRALDLPARGEDQWGRLVEYLRQRELLLLLDGFERFHAEAPLIIRLLRECPDLTVLVTSRARLGLREEWVLELGGLAYPPAGSMQPKEQFKAVELFVEGARRILPDFELPGSCEEVAEICRLAEGFPRRILKAVSLLDRLSCREIAEVMRVLMGDEE